MCGRYTFTQAPDESVVVQPEGMNIPLIPRYNIAPSQYVALSPQEDPDHIHFYRWGLIPHWAKDEKVGYMMINARSETLLEKASFKGAFRKHRCLIWADGFYEWKKSPSGKQPYRIILKSGEVFAFAGIAARWKSPEGKWLKSCSIITTEPNGLMADIHNRMPVILKKEDEAQWLDPEVSAEDLLPLLKPFNSEQMKAYTVSPAVGKVQNDSEHLIELWQPPPTLF